MIFLHWQTCVPLINLQLRFTICRMMHAKDRKRLVKSAAKNHKVCHAIACELHIETCIRLKKLLQLPVYCRTSAQTLAKSRRTQGSKQIQSASVCIRISSHPFFSALVNQLSLSNLLDTSSQEKFLYLKFCKGCIDPAEDIAPIVDCTHLHRCTSFQSICDTI